MTKILIMLNTVVESLSPIIGLYCLLSESHYKEGLYAMFCLGGISSVLSFYLAYQTTQKCTK